MDRYKFRGKREIGGELVYGDILNTSDGTFIITSAETMSHGDETDLYATDWNKVIPSTVAQYTGLKDKNGVEIYEGDVMDSNDSGHMVIKGMVAFRKGRFVLGQTEGREDELMDVVDCGYTVIGNIHDNKELLKGASSNDTSNFIP